MKVLITNAHLENYSGTEVVVRDLAFELKRQGHEPLVYSPALGAVAEEIGRGGIHVSDQLTDWTSPPDIIHGHHHPQTLEALLHFASTPAVFVCHAVAAVEEPFYFPRILRYIAVDDRCRKFVESIPGIPDGRIEVMPNAVDLNRFPARDALPATPRQALVFSNYASRSTHLPAVRSACRRAGLHLDVLGLGAGNAVANPETVLPGYDVVFAKARCALEAMAAGCAVVLVDFAGAGPMVSSANFDELRRMNFGAGVLTSPLRAEHIQAEIERYDSADAAQVSQRVRKEAGLVEAAQRWMKLYSDVIREFRSARQDFPRELDALSGYLARWNYGKRVAWEMDQLKRLEKLPVAGRVVRRLARRFLRGWGQP